MDYVITSDLPFAEIEARTIDALERQGLAVQRTFSLRSAAEAGRGGAESRPATGSRPGYTILMLYASGGQRPPLGLLTLYERGGTTVISPVLTPAEDGDPSAPGDTRAAADADADLLATLVHGGLEICLGLADSGDCVDLRAATADSLPPAGLVQDPVCGKWIEVGQAEAVIEQGGTAHYVCCPLCRESLEREPDRYL